MKKILVLFLMILCSFGARAVSLSDNALLWVPDKGKGVAYCGCKCQSYESDKLCIGDNASTCNDNAFPVKVTDSDYGKIVMMLVEANVGGALFCPVVVIGQKVVSDTMLTYFYNGIYYKRLTTGTDNCVWLCHDGYAGDRCQQEITVNTSYAGMCDANLLLRSNYNDIKYNSTVANDLGLNDIVTRSDNAGYGFNCDDCGSIRSYDIIMVISDWLNSGNGAWVQPYVIEAGKSGTTYGVNTYPAVYSGTCPTTKHSKQLGCKVGYKPNSAKNDCEPINVANCNSSGPLPSEYCDGWDVSRFNSTIHSTIRVGTGNNACYQWRCRDQKKILDVAGGTECTWYVWSPQRGVNPKDGTGVQCPTAMVFNANVHGDGVSVDYCEDTIRVSGDVLLYGNGSSSTTWDKQCWTKTNPEEYKKCVALGVK